jgi:hypothetical protein
MFPCSLGRRIAFVVNIVVVILVVTVLTMNRVAYAGDRVYGGTHMIQQNNSCSGGSCSRCSGSSCSQSSGYRGGLLTGALIGFGTAGLIAAIISSNNNNSGGDTTIINNNNNYYGCCDKPTPEPITTPHPTVTPAGTCTAVPTQTPCPTTTPHGTIPGVLPTPPGLPEVPKYQTPGYHSQRSGSTSLKDVQSMLVSSSSRQSVPAARRVRPAELVDLRVDQF